MNRFARLLQRQSWRHGATLALQDEQRSLHYADLAIATAVLADQLMRCDPGMRVASVLDNGIDAAVLELAVRRVGGLHAALPPYFSADQLQHALATLQPNLLVLPSGSAPPAANWQRAEVPALPGSAVWMTTADTPHRGEFASSGSVSFTSGSTGEPKGVMLDEQLLWTVANSLAESAAPLAVRSHLCALPLATLLETVAGLYAGLLIGATIQLPSLSTLGYNGASGLDAETFHHCIAESAPHSLILVPQLLESLTGMLERGAARLPSLRLLAVGGAAVGPSFLQRAERVGLPVFEGYGLTECGSVVCLNRPGAQRPGSVGKPLPHVRLRIDDHGEIHVRGARPLGVIGTETLTPRSRELQWDEEYATGDLGHLDEDGFLYLHGRRRNVFITAYGRNVSPEWVESLLCDEPCISQAWVHGEARAWNAAVLVTRDAAVRTDELEHAIARCNARLPSYAQIGGYLRCPQPFQHSPGLTTANGRLRREALIGHFEAALASLPHNPRLQSVGSASPALHAPQATTLKEYASA